MAGSRTLWIWLLAMPLASCGGSDPADLLVDVRTDLRPGYEFQSVRIELVGAGSAGSSRVELPATADQAARYLEGIRLAEFEDVDRSQAAVRVALLNASGLPVVERAASVRLGDRDRIVTVVLTRDCAGVSCPGPGDDPELRACVGGRCVDPRCTPETPEHCGTGCTEDSECTAEASCATSRCEQGTCLRVERSGACDELEWCHPEMGCVARPVEMDATVPGDAGPDAAVAPDAGVGSFRVPVLLDVLSDPTLREDDPTLTADLLEIYYNVTDGYGQIWRSTRDSATDPWSPPEQVSELSGINLTNPDISPDGLTLYLNEGNVLTADSSWDTVVSTRATRSDPWSSPSLVTELTTPDAELNGAVESTHTRLVLSRAPVHDPQSIYEAVRLGPSDPWGTPQLLASVSSPAWDESPFLTTSGLELYFESSRSPAGIYVARRATVDGPFDPPTHVDELDFPGTNGDPWVSPDGRLMIFSSSRSGNGDLYQATR